MISVSFMLLMFIFVGVVLFVHITPDDEAAAGSGNIVTLSIVSLPALPTGPGATTTGGTVYSLKSKPVVALMVAISNSGLVLPIKNPNVPMANKDVTIMTV